MSNLETGWPKLSKNDFLFFEQSTGLKLKGEIRKFYKRINGGFISEIPEEFPIYIQMLYPLVYSGPDETVLSVRKDLLSECKISNDDIPFAWTGSAYCIYSMQKKIVWCLGYTGGEGPTWLTLDRFFLDLCGAKISGLKYSDNDDLPYEDAVKNLKFEKIKSLLDKSLFGIGDIWFCAIRLEKFEVIEFLINEGYNVDGLLHKYLRVIPSTRVLDRLLEAGMDINQLDDEGRHVLDIVKPGWVPLLIERGAIKL